MLYRPIIRVAKLDCMFIMCQALYRFLLILTTTGRRYKYYFHSPDGKTKAWRSPVTCPRLHN